MIPAPQVTKRQAARFLLLRHGLLGRRQYRGKAGVLTLRRFWPEPGFRDSAAFRSAFGGALRRLARLNGCRQVETLE